jgi:hypothetical protein
LHTLGLKSYSRLVNLDIVDLINPMIALSVIILIGAHFRIQFKAQTAIFKMELHYINKKYHCAVNFVSICFVIGMFNKFLIRIIKGKAESCSVSVYE